MPALAWLSLLLSLRFTAHVCPFSLNQLKGALKLPPSTDFYEYLVEWPFNLSYFFETD